MKKIILGLITWISLCITVNAQEKADFTLKSEFKSASFKTIFRNESTEYKFGSLDEFNQGTDEILNDTDFSKEAPSNSCEVTIEFKVSVTVGVTIVTVSGSITTTCIQAASEAKRLKTMLIAATVT